MIIVGAGMAGLIAANILKHHEPTIIEAQPSLPNNHKALLRFRSNRIGAAVGIPFREVFVRKAIVHDTTFLEVPNPYACNMYSFKVTGQIMDRSIWDITPGPRYIAPDDFIRLLSRGHNIRFNTRFAIERSDDPIVSTIPMPVMMDMVGWKNKPVFEYNHIWALNTTIVNPKCNIHQTIYFTDLSNPCYRASIVGDRFIAEFVGQPTNKSLHEVLDYFGLPASTMCDDPTITKQAYGKIVPIDDELRKEFIYTLTREYNIYSLGRFATWRQLVLDDLVDDIELIKGLIGGEKRRRLYTQALTVSRHSAER